MRMLITPTLLNSFDYYFNFEGEASEDDDGNIVTAEQKEAEARREFLQTLSREKFQPTPAMQAGIDFENRVLAYCRGASDDSIPVREIGEIVKGGMWQQRCMRELGDFLLYGKMDVIKRDTIYDLKRSKSYDVGKYQRSTQHRIYLYCSNIPRFSYLITDDRSWWTEDYSNNAYIEQEIQQSIHQFTGYLEHDAEAKMLYYDRWKSLEEKAA